MPAGTHESTAASHHPGPGSGGAAARRHTVTIDNAITHPGSVRINVQEAYIVEDDSSSSTEASNGINGALHHDTKDIRLPKHTAVVSHVAVDVSG